MEGSSPPCGAESGEDDGPREDDQAIDGDVGADVRSDEPGREGEFTQDDEHGDHLGERA
jgi:hypothetical protein